MAEKRRRMSRRGWLHVAAWTLFGTLGCLSVSLTFNWLTFRNLGAEASQRGLFSATVLPIVLAGPLFFYLTVKLRELAALNHQLNELASRDGLTGCLNRSGFTAVVERHLEQVRGDDTTSCGGMLMVDADHFKDINDRFGHDRGDEALALIVSAIRAALRANDKVGRLGGEEFGVHLPAADRAAMAMIAERVRRSVAAAQFLPDGKPHRLSVSVGGVSYAGQSSFKSLFRVADQNLYTAKRLGRDRVQLEDAPGIAPDLADMAEAV